MKKWIYGLSVPLLLFFVSIAYAKTPGEQWNSFDEAKKTATIVGFQEGYERCFRLTWGNLMVGEDMKEKMNSQEARFAFRAFSRVTTTAPETLKAAIDKFYADPAHEDLSISFSIFYAAQELNGMPEKELRAFIAGEREYAPRFRF